MLALFSKNCILMGDLDSYCLVCSIRLTDVLKHLINPIHHSKLTKTAYFEKYKDDYIKKVNGVYFCEVCNKTFLTSSKVGIHVTEETHIKGIRRQLTRVGTSVVFQKDTLIEERAWNGLVEGTCVVCNVDIEDHSTHMYGHSHALHVVRSTVTVDDDNNIYRKIDGGYQCLTCNKVVSNTEISKHLDSERHKAARVSLACTRNGADNNYIDRRNEEKKQQMKENKANGDDDNTEVTSSQNVDSTVSTDNPPVIEVKATMKLMPVSEGLECYAKEYGMFVTQDRLSLTCHVCSTVVPGTMQKLKQHIVGKKHADNIKSLAQADKELNAMKIEKVPPTDYFRQTLILDCDYVIVNDSFCVEFNHFFCLLDTGKIMCQLCDLQMDRESKKIHVSSRSHEFKLQNTFVITSLKDEFVRQIKSRYHCGFCGVFRKDITFMLEHLSSAAHRHLKLARRDIFQKFKNDELQNYNTMELNLFDLERSNEIN